MYFSIKITLLNELQNNNETNNISLDFEIQRSLDVSISDSNLYKKEFGIKDAIPISLNLESFIFIKTNCMHNILHIFKLPVRTEIKWKIQGGITNGAFKIGNGMDAEYFPQDSGDSVIFYPQLQNNNDNHGAIKKGSLKSDSKKNIGSKKKAVGLEPRERRAGTGGRQTTLDTLESSKKRSRG